MKKYFVAAAVLLMGITLSAQDEGAVTGSDRLDEIENLAVKAKQRKAEKRSDLVSFDVIGEFGYGDSVPIGKNVFSLKGNDTREIWFQILGLSVNPAEWLSIGLHANLKWDRLMASSEYYFQFVDGDFKASDISVQEALYPEAGGTFKTLRSQVNLFSVEVPLMFDFYFSDLVVGAGFEGGYIFSARQKEKVEYSKTTIRKAVGGGNTSGFYYGPTVRVAYNDLGVYAKYIPVDILGGDTFGSLVSIGVYVKF